MTAASAPTTTRNHTGERRRHTAASATAATASMFRASGPWRWLTGQHADLERHQQHRGARRVKPAPAQAALGRDRQAVRAGRRDDRVGRAADADRSGIRARTSKPCVSVRRPACSSPPYNLTRSFMPTSPCPGSSVVVAVGRRAGVRCRRPRSSRQPAATVTLTRARARPACLIAFVSASCTTR